MTLTFNRERAILFQTMLAKGIESGGRVALPHIKSREDLLMLVGAANWILSGVLMDAEILRASDVFDNFARMADAEYESRFETTIQIQVDAKNVEIIGAKQQQQAHVQQEHAPDSFIGRGRARRAQEKLELKS